MKRFLSLLFAIISIITASCGSNNSSDAGAIAFSLSWQQKASVQKKAPVVSKVAPAGVYNIRATISGPGMSNKEQLFAATPGQSGSGTINGVPVGADRTLTIQGLDSNMNVLYEAIVQNITVTKGQTYDCGNVTMNYVGGGLSAPAGVTATAGNGQVALNWNTVTNAVTYNIYWSTSPGVNKQSADKIIDITTNSFTHMGLTNGTEYFYVVTAVSGSSESIESLAVSAIPSAQSAAHGWAWMKGPNVKDQYGTYGTQGTPDAANTPGARDGSVSWKDGSGNLWLFGGFGNDYSATTAYLNDLWKFDGTNWIWVKGSNTVNQGGVYGTKGVAEGTNTPGARSGAISWIDGSGVLWLFGGGGYDSFPTWGYLNDLWKFDGTNWTWINGSNTANQAGVYGTKGVANPANVPGARMGAISWTDGSSLWLFGGSEGTNYFNDLWRFDGTNWTWVSGANTPNQAGTYGTKGVANPANVPGARSSALSWRDAANSSLWLFGGTSDGTNLLNDLWMFDTAPLQWTWVSGDNFPNEPGVYGTKGSAGASNKPGARRDAVSWRDSAGNFWLFGGYGYDTVNSGYINDLWKFNGTNWAWMGGTDIINQTGVYGSIGVVDAANVPGSRLNAVPWFDSNGNLWLFGGLGYDSAGAPGLLNDLWRYNP